MKRFTTPCAGLALLAGIGGCVDLGEKLVSNLSSEYIETQAGLTAGTNAIYQQLRGYYGKEQHMALTDMGTDIFTNGDQVSSGAQAWFYLADYSSGLNSSDARIQEFWNPMYVLIARANVVLDKGPNTPTGGDLTAATKASRLGEAHFLRALAYFELVQAFGDVTLNLQAEAGVSTSATRAPAAEVYRAIIADLDAAVAQLPETQTEWGRVRKGAAQHLLAKVYLTRGYKEYGGGQADFQKALDNAQAVISSGRYPLSPVYADLFCGTNAADPNRQGYCNALNWNRQNPEIIFAVQYSYNPQQYVQPSCTVNGDPSICANYLHLVYLSRYDNDNNIGVALPRDLNNGRPFRRIRGTPFLFSLYDRTRWTGTPGQSDILDTRFDGTFQTLWFATTSGGRNATGPCPTATVPGNCTSGAVVNAGDTALWMPGYQVTDAFRQSKKFTIYVPCAQQNADPAVQCGRDNKLFRIYGWEVGPSVKKHQDNGRTGGVADQAGGKDVILMRSGETYLIAAEAAFKVGQNQQAADFINVLRQRAASPAHKGDWSQYMGVTAANITLDFIMDERARELAGEMNRWQDLARPGGQYFVDRIKRWNPEARPNVQTFHALRPIPQQQINGVTGTPYPQNPGY